MEETRNASDKTACRIIASRVIELVVLFVLVPVLQATGWLPLPILAVLALAAIGCGVKLFRDRALKGREWFQWRVSPIELRRVLLTFAAAIPMLIALVWWLRPAALFALPRERPGIWLLVMLLYPLVSVYPQEIVFRAFFFHRYRVLFGNGAWLVAASAISFAFAHIGFHNWVALALTLPGGILFGLTYHRTSALLFVAIEHALYGCLVFTVGLGAFLLEGTLRLIQ